MTEQKKELEAQLLTQLRILTSNLALVSDKADYLKSLKISFRDFVDHVTYWPMDYDRLEKLEYCRRDIQLAANSSKEASDYISSVVYKTKSLMSDLEKVVNDLPETQELKIKQELMKETNELEKRELELKKSIVSKQSESEKISKGLRRLVGFSSVLVVSFTTVGILFPYVWVLCVTTIFVGIITLFIGLNMLFGLHKDGILDAGTLEKDKVELDWVQTKKAQLFLESNQ